MFSSIITLVLLSASVLAAVPTDCSRNYTVQSGDWCDTISASQQSSTYQLAYSNQDTINDCCTNLQVGQVICLAPKTGPDCTSIHVVADADTCETVAATYTTNTTMLLANNLQLGTECTIYPGQVLCVADALMAVAPPTTSKWVAPHPCEDDSSTLVYTPLSTTPVVVAATTTATLPITPATTTVAAASSVTPAIAPVTSTISVASVTPATTTSTTTDDDCDEDDDTTSTVTTSTADDEDCDDDSTTTDEEDDTLDEDDCDDN